RRLRRATQIQAASRPSEPGIIVFVHRTLWVRLEACIWVARRRRRSLPVLNLNLNPNSEVQSPKPQTLTPTLSHRMGEGEDESGAPPSPIGWERVGVRV